VFHTRLTKDLFDQFLSSNQLNRSEMQSAPYVYVDGESGEIKYLANLLRSHGPECEIMAVSIAKEGDLEFLSTEE
tara:strand:+ start:208634 stop:208858 length:225 start_codon:yes stop_codon:yes gene_type:complete